MALFWLTKTTNFMPQNSCCQNIWNIQHIQMHNFFLPFKHDWPLTRTLHSHYKLCVWKKTMKIHLNKNFPQANLTWLSQPMTAHYFSVLIGSNIPRSPALGYSCRWLEPSEAGWWFLHQRGSRHFVLTLRVLELPAAGSPQTARPGRTNRKDGVNFQHMRVGDQHLTKVNECFLVSGFPWLKMKTNLNNYISTSLQGSLKMHASSTCDESWGRINFFLAFFLVALSKVLASTPATTSTCRLFLAVLWSAVAENTAAPRSNSTEVRFGVRGRVAESMMPTLSLPSFGPTASSITRTNSSWKDGKERKLSSFTEASDLVQGTVTLIADEPWRRASLLFLGGFTGATMPFFLCEKKSVTRAWDILRWLETEKQTAT